MTLNVKHAITVGCLRMVSVLIAQQEHIMKQVTNNVSYALNNVKFVRVLSMHNVLNAYQVLIFTMILQLIYTILQIVFAYLAKTEIAHR